MASFMAALGWPHVTLIFAIVFLMVFRKQIEAFISRIRHVNTKTLRIEAGDENQIENVEKLNPPNVAAMDINDAMINPLVREQAAVIRSELTAFQLSDSNHREELLIKTLAAVQIQVEFERVYFMIFGSQLGALRELSASVRLGPISVDSLKRYYEEEVLSREGGTTQTFERWMGFMEAVVLVILNDGKVSITVRGQEFLKYLIDRGYPLEK